MYKVVSKLFGHHPETHYSGTYMYKVVDINDDTIGSYFNESDADRHCILLSKKTDGVE